MQKTTVLFILQMLVLSACAQNFEHRFSGGISNNGLIRTTLNDFYFDSNGYNPNDDVNEYNQKESNFRYRYELLYKSAWFAGLSYGHGFRDDSYVVGNQGQSKPAGTEKINYTMFAFSLGHVWDFKKFNFSSGIEIPIYKVSDFIYTYSQTDIPNQTLIIKSPITGGKGWGITTTNSIRFFLHKNFFIGTTLNAGLVKLKIEGTQTLEVIEQIPVVYGDTTLSVERPYELTAFAPPELIILVGFKF